MAIQKRFLFLATIFCAACVNVAKHEGEELSVARAPANVIDGKVLTALLETMPASYAFRNVCVYSTDKVIGSYSTLKTWADRGKHYFSHGTLSKFPEQNIEYDPRGVKVRPISMDYPNGPEDWTRFEKLKAKAKGTGDEIFRAKGEVRIGNTVFPAECAFESGARLE